MDAQARILYLVHDTADAAVRRRTVQLKAGGAAVVVGGFRRVATVPDGMGAVIDFGQTKPARFASRIASVVGVLARAERFRRAVGRPDVILCRNLEMLAIGRHFQKRFAPEARVAYESLDIHRLLLSERFAGTVLRWLERSLAAGSTLLITSSPAFIREYFSRLNRIDVPTLLLENKVLDLGPSPASTALQDLPEPSAPPWRIGWFGNLRCQRSLDVLCELAEKQGGAVEIDIRGIPADHEFRDFHSQVARTKHVRFLGPYRNPGDLPAIYGAVHFVWAIDYFEAGLNSDWLLPNRLYEGGLQARVPIAVSSVQTGAWLRERGLGVLIDAADAAELSTFFTHLTPEAYAALRHAVASMPRETWTSGLAECRHLVAALVGNVAPLEPATPVS